MTDPHGHCPSYYAATCNDVTSYPSLRGELRTDVCVIGGGFTGIATALTLAERGYQVVVLEQNLVGWGATGRNGGQLIAGLSGEEGMAAHGGEGIEDVLFDMGYRGHQIIAERVKRYEIDCDLKYGYMEVAVRKRHLCEQRKWYEALCGRGLESDLRLVNGRDLPSIIGTDRYLGGLINNRNGHLHPLNLCLGEARAAVSLGAAIYERSAVTDIVRGKRPQVVTAQGKVSADFVVLAGNAYHQLAQDALSGLVFPAGSYIVATEPLSEEEARGINPLDLAVCDQNAVLDYFRLSADRRLLFGGRCNYSGREPRNIEASIVPRMHHIYPQLGSKRIDFAWGGSIGIVPNRVPLVGKLDDQVFYSFGYSGHGVNVTHLCGEVVADAIMGTFERMDVFSRVPHRRIPLGRAFGNQLVALGMLYYRLRDLL